MEKKILVIYATYGSGHKAIANYIKKYIENKNENITVKAIDLLDYSDSVVGKLGKNISENLMLHHPFIWNLVYKSSDHKYTCAFSSKVILKPFKNKRLEKEIASFNPDLTIATHFYGANIISMFNKHKIINSKLISIVTDYEAHEMWLENFKDQDYLVVSSKEEEKSLVKEGYQKDKIKAYGIPIFPANEEEVDKAKILNDLGLKIDKLTCLCFAGGGNGSTGTLPYIKNILKLRKDTNLIIISGRNKKAYDKIKKYIERYESQNTLLYGFVNNVPEFLQISDFVITKPGGAQTTECLYFKKPMLLIKSSGGQENANVKYFTRKGFAKKFRTPRGLLRFYKNLTNGSKELEKMKNKLSKTDNQSSMKKIYELVVKTLKEKK